jgi:hypothetical protein
VPNAVRFRKALLPWFADAVPDARRGRRAVDRLELARGREERPSSQYQTASLVTCTLRCGTLTISCPSTWPACPAPLRPWIRGVLRKLAVWDVADVASEWTAMWASRGSSRSGSGEPIAAALRCCTRRYDVDADPGRHRTPRRLLCRRFRLVSYKRLDLAVQAAGLAGRRLVVIGQVRARARSRRWPAGNRSSSWAGCPTAPSMR